MTSTPLVSFVVPCYQLGHLLRECVNSVLCQSYENFEILIMDDCSPDDTPVVARAFDDTRVIHVRNQVNLGHLANYNEGIRRARGDYVWLISADDKLLRPYVLERFVTVLEQQPNAGFVFCPAIRFRGSEELGLQGSLGAEDTIWSGRDFLGAHLLAGNPVPAPSGLVRRECYAKVGGFPLDLPFAGDWYMWAAFAFQFDVAYRAEAMVGRRDHASNMTKWFERKAHLLVADEFEVLWRLLAMFEGARDRKLVAAVEKALIERYGYRVHQQASGDAIGMSRPEFEESIEQKSNRKRLKAFIRAEVYARLADHERENGGAASARKWFRKALWQRPGSLRTAVKLALLHLGSVGQRALDLWGKFGRRATMRTQR